MHIMTKLARKFDKLFPKSSGRAVGMKLTGWNELEVKMKDGSKVLYDDITSTCRLLPNDYSDLSEQEFRNEFAKRLKTIMKTYNISQTELAEKAGINQISISNYLHEKCTPSFYIVYKIAVVLGCSVTDLIYLGGR